MSVRPSHFGVFGGAEVRESRQWGPSLLVSAEKLKELQLSAPEKYLLSRVNGTRQLSAIVNASPLQELEALKWFHRFVQTGLVRLG